MGLPLRKRSIKSNGDSVGLEILLNDRRRPRTMRTIGMVTVVAAAVLAQSGDRVAAQAADRWTVGETEAVATLPAARGGSAVAQATLSCAAQRWSLVMAMTELGGGASEAGAVLAIDGRTFDARAALDGKTITIPVPGSALAPLKDGLRLTISIDGLVGGMLGEVAFALLGSRVAIEAVEDRCSLRDMTGYTPVTFTPYSSYMNLARDLRATDIKAFVAATSSQPDLAVAMSEFDEGRRVLFTRLCGSSWYYGTSGCNITGFAPEGDAWRIAYDTENVHLFLDPRSRRDGWPDIATLPVRGSGEGRLWRWNGKAYDLVGTLPDE